MSAPVPSPGPSFGPQHAIVTRSGNVPAFRFDGGAGDYFVVSLLGGLLTVFTLGIAYPWAMCMRYAWRADHTLVYGYRTRFAGTGGDLFVHWIKWWLLCLVTLGIYGFWVVPRLTRWIVEHQEFSTNPEV